MLAVVAEGVPRDGVGGGEAEPGVAVFVVEVAEAQPPHQHLDARVGILEGSAAGLDGDAEGVVVVARVEGIDAGVAILGLAAIA